MPVGDIIKAMANLAGFGNLVLQPAVGQEILLMNIAGVTNTGTNPNGAFLISLELFNGVNAALITQTSVNAKMWPNLKTYANNTNYVRVVNNNPAAQVVCVGGMETK